MHRKHTATVHAGWSIGQRVSGRNVPTVRIRYNIPRMLVEGAYGVSRYAIPVAITGGRRSLRGWMMAMHRA
jgi:hypothetical protein